MQRKWFVYIFIFSLIFASKAQAFLVSPVGYKSTISPGEKQVFNIVVTNNEREPHRYQVEMNSVRNTEDGRRYYEKNYDAAEGWASISDGNFTLAPNTSKTVAISMNVPVGTAPGSHALAFMVQTANLLGAQIGINAKSAIPLSLIVAGRVTEQLTIKSFSSESKIFWKNTWPFSISLLNEGTVDVLAGGKFEINDWLGHKTIEKNLYLGNTIYPASNRNINFEVSSASSFWPGRYTAHAVFQYGAKKTYLSSQTTFWFFPAWFKILVLIILFILSFGLWKKRK